MTVRRIVDLSAPIVSSPPGTPEFQRTTIAFLDHAAGAVEVQALFGVPPRLLRSGEGWTRETVTLGTHNSTHVDAPNHYNSIIQGRPAATIDELPLETFIGPGVVVDFTDRADGDAIDAQAMEQALASAGHALQAGEIVLVRTGRDAFYGQPDYINRGPGVTARATRWLYDRGVRVMGIDAWGWDRPLGMQAKEALEKDAPGIFWEAHQADLPYSQIERLVNLDQLPSDGFTVSCLPLRLVGAGGAPARVVAIFED
jgi:kynurenine formamidase